jgi:hypothetical protein
MKNTIKFASLISIILVMNPINTKGLQIESYLFNNKKASPSTKSITHQQTKGQVHFFREALDEFGATSPEQVVNIWVKAEETRNGVYHYSVACDELKRKIIEKWGEPEDSFWIYGGADPSLDKYEIIYNKKLSDSAYEVKIKFFWGSAIGPSDPTETTLTILRSKDIWCVSEFK